MRYSEKFPNTPCDILMKEFDCCMIKVPTPGLCFVCGSPTHWVDIDYQGYLCSEECGKRAIEDAARLAKRERSEMKLLWLDGDEMDSWDDLIEHLEFLGEIKRYKDNLYWYKGVLVSSSELIDILAPLVELNAQLYDAWGLLYQVRNLPEQGKSDEDIPDDKCEAYEMGYEDAVTDGVSKLLAPIKEKIRAYLENPIGWREKE